MDFSCFHFGLSLCIGLHYCLLSISLTTCVYVSVRACVVDDAAFKFQLELKHTQHASRQLPIYQLQFRQSLGTHTRCAPYFRYILLAKHLLLLDATFRAISSFFGSKGVKLHAFRICTCSGQILLGSFARAVSALRVIGLSKTELQDLGMKMDLIAFYDQRETKRIANVATKPILILTN